MDYPLQGSMSKTYICRKCKYVSLSNSDRELKKHIREHSKKCDGILEKPEGNCLPTAFSQLIFNPHWLFCYTFLEFNGCKYIHAWNESKGEVREANGNKYVETKNIRSNKMFAFDFSSGNSFAGEVDEYYKQQEIKEVKKLKLKEIIRLMNDCLQEGKDMWDWVC